MDNPKLLWDVTLKLYHEIAYHLICFARLFGLKSNGYIIVFMCKNWCPSVARWNEMFKELPREGVKFHSPEIYRGLSCCLSFAWPKLQYIRYTFFSPSCSSLYRVIIFAVTLFSKGQLISEWLFDFLNFPKNQRKIWWISALESKKWLNQKDKFTLLYVK